MINEDELESLSTIKSEKSFVAEVLVHYRAPGTGYLGFHFFKPNIELNITGITYSYDVKEEYRDDCFIHQIYCNFVNKLTESRISRKIVPKEDRDNKYYDSIYLIIKCSEAMKKFKIVCKPDFSQIDINNKVHRQYIIKQFLCSGEFQYDFDESLQQKLDEIKKDYQMGMLTRNEAINFLLILFEGYLNDLNCDENIDRINDLNQN